jgi:nitrogen fixation/metabolism regulation signal transduction histidine kinase
MIEQVLTNLVRNGVEAMRTTRPAQRALTISARREAECRVVVRVVDQGLGVPSCDEAQLFTPFFTAKPRVTTKTMELHRASLMSKLGVAICRISSKCILATANETLFFEYTEQQALSRRLRRLVPVHPRWQDVLILGDRTSSKT